MLARAYVRRLDCSRTSERERKAEEEEEPGWRKGKTWRAPDRDAVTVVLRLAGAAVSCGAARRRCCRAAALPQLTV